VRTKREIGRGGDTKSAAGIGDVAVIGVAGGACAIRIASNTAVTSFSCLEAIISASRGDWGRRSFRWSNRGRITGRGRRSFRWRIASCNWSNRRRIASSSWDNRRRIASSSWDNRRRIASSSWGNRRSQSSHTTSVAVSDHLRRTLACAVAARTTIANFTIVKDTVTTVRATSTSISNHS